VSILTCELLSASGETADISVLGGWRNTAVGRTTKASSAVIPTINGTAVRVLSVDRMAVHLSSS
jgi:hypothetical protein